MKLSVILGNLKEGAVNCSYSLAYNHLCTFRLMYCVGLESYARAVTMEP